MANRSNFQQDIDKILFVLSYMKEGTANLWAKNYVEEFLAGDVEPTWETCKKALDESFQDPNKQATAQNDLANCRMKKGETVRTFPFSSSFLFILYPSFLCLLIMHHVTVHSCLPNSIITNTVITNIPA